MHFFQAVLHSRIRSGLPLIPGNQATEDEERKVRKAQQLRLKAAKLGASAIVEATDMAGERQEVTDEDGKKEKPNIKDTFAATAGRPMSAPTTDVENFYVFMAAAAAVKGNDKKPGHPTVRANSSTRIRTRTSSSSKKAGGHE